MPSNRSPKSARRTPKRPRMWPGVLAVLLCMAVFLAGCTGPAPSEPESAVPQVSSLPAVPEAPPLSQQPQWRVLCLMPATQDERGTQLARGVQDRLTQLGIDVVMNDDYTGPAQENALPADILDEVDGLLCFEALPIQGALEAQLATSGTPAVSAGWAVSGAHPLALADEADCGRLLGEAAGRWLAAHAPEGRVLLLHGDETTTPGRSAGVADGLGAEAPDTDVVWVDAGADFDAEALAEEIIADDGVAALLAGSAEPAALAVADALQAAGFDRAIYLGGVGGVGGSAEAIQAVEGTGLFCATVAPRWYEAGQAAADALAALLEGQPPPAKLREPLLVEHTDKLSIP